MHTLILGGQKSGKSRAAEQRAADWLAAGAGRRATLIATAWPGDDEMRARIARHQADRAARAPGLATHELAGGIDGDLAAALHRLAADRHLLVVDCLTLWLTQLLMPPPGLPVQDAAAAIDRLCAALADAPAPVVLVSNEIGLGVMPLGAETRRFLDTLGLLHQRLAGRCDRVTLMVAGLPVHLKGGAA
ncbi:bifunctional adenosylcobinamide kinase/adenosylcobinamide-phosphate guanylyltransferase [Leptothrix sp. BB-4]